MAKDVLLTLIGFLMGVFVGYASSGTPPTGGAPVTERRRTWQKEWVAFLSFDGFSEPPEQKGTRR